MALASIITRPGVRYPGADEFFSPSEAYPEYRHGHVATKPNPVYSMVREVFAQASLDRANFGTPAWNPLGQHIKPGNKVFVLCNFVHHRRRTESAEDFLGKCTHGSVVRAVIDYVLLALEGESGTQNHETTDGWPTGSVVFGNAPLQSCDFERVLRETGAAVVRDFFAQRHLPVQVKDLRLFVTERAVSGRTTRTIMRDQSEGIPVVLDDQSLLHELDPAPPTDAPPTDAPTHRRTDAPAYRVADYDPEFMRDWHDHRKHRYFIHRSILESDVIFCVPKLKTHEKVGITCALKGYVGIVGRKECLPHHRFGPPAEGGDEYPRGNPLLRLHSWLGDWANSTRGKAEIGTAGPQDHGTMGPREEGAKVSGQQSVVTGKNAECGRQDYATTGRSGSSLLAPRSLLPAPRPVTSTFSFLLSAFGRSLPELAYHTLGRVLRRLGCVTSGAWQGNDTTWRMALDLARIAHYAGRDGKPRETLCRTNLMLTDGIVGGEGEGPLAPTGAASACLLFSDDVALGDLLACRLMGINPELVPLVKHAHSVLAQGRTQGPKTESSKICYNGSGVCDEEILPALQRSFAPPRGWRGVLR